MDNLAENELILAIDVGTSSVRAALYDTRGDYLLPTFVKNERTITSTDDGGAEIDANEAVNQVIAAIDAVLEKSTEIAGNIKYLAASSFWHSLLGIDADGKPTTKVLAWADTRSRDSVDSLLAAFKEKEIHNRTGARFHSSFWTAKLHWIKQTQPETFSKTAKWLSFSDYLMLRLIGNAVTSVSMASATGIFDIRKLRWDADILDFLEISIKNLAEIAPADDFVYELNEEFKQRWKRLKNIKIFPAIGDGAANNIGAGCVDASQAALMIGTSGAMRVVWKGEPPMEIPDGLWCYRVDRERVILGGALSDGGGLYRWLKDNLKLTGSDDEIESEIARRRPTAHGLIFLPFLAGERSTGYHRNAHGAVIGLRSSTDSIDIVQAALESVAYRFAEIFDEIRSVVNVERIIASGGALRESPVWTQTIADVLQKDLFLPDTREASSRGAAISVLQNLRSGNSPMSETSVNVRQFSSAPENKDAYERGRKRQLEIYRVLIGS